ncbi:MAG: FkbM family methyltransferase [Alphaproteobacteria bacterium]
MSFPFKDLTYLGRSFRVHGLSADDRYFQTLHNDLEPEFVRFCRSFVRPDHVCFDLGANIGLKSLIMATQASSGKVIAVEPGPSIGSVLDLNMRTNHAANVVVEKVAIGDRTGTVRFVEESAFGYVGDGDVDVPMITLPALAKKLDLPRADFIKIDVEGLEFPILKDSLDFINSNASLVYFEFNAWAQMVNADVRPKEFAKWLLSSFSHVYVVKKAGDYADLLWRLDKGQWREILDHNCFHSGFVNDIVVTNAPWRMEPARDAALSESNERLAQWNEAVIERDVARAELATARAERDAMQAQLAALQNSTSWKVTSGLRAIGRALKPRP